ncbi:actin-binding Rho-activating protein-like [Anthonomus grandis grandis]|uniref:actin-binding Rho-activating protein-like n=1 Tax=Anthonomus grandis grandis TaxID=2921223 RepID=UPI00216582FC|nr:actin-binding Rho-activating protein-like [Anthonomus grandis grandis]
MSACVNERRDSPLKNRVALFNTFADNHTKKQAVNPFSNDKCVSNLPKPKISKEDYGRPAKGSLSEQRSFKATIQVCKEMLQLCEVINQCGEPLFEPHEKQDDPRKVISFGNLFTIYTGISDKVVGMLIRARKHKLVDFEGECLFQRRDDHVPIILLKSYKDIERILMEKIEQAASQLRESIALYGELDTGNYI